MAEASGTCPPPTHHSPPPTAIPSGTCHHPNLPCEVVCVGAHAVCAAFLQECKPREGRNVPIHHGPGRRRHTPNGPPTARPSPTAPTSSTALRTVPPHASVLPYPDLTTSLLNVHTSFPTGRSQLEARPRLRPSAGSGPPCPAPCTPPSGCIARGPPRDKPLAGDCPAQARLPRDTAGRARGAWERSPSPAPTPHMLRT